MSMDNNNTSPRAILRVHMSGRVPCGSVMFNSVVSGFREAFLEGSYTGTSSVELSSGVWFMASYQLELLRGCVRSSCCHVTTNQLGLESWFMPRVLPRR